jgi:hypothetical protein
VISYCTCQCHHILLEYKERSVLTLFNPTTLKVAKG